MLLHTCSDQNIHQDTTNLSCFGIEESDEIYNLKNECQRLQKSFSFEMSDIGMKLKAKDEQLRSANEYLETLTCERENDRAEICRLTTDLNRERRSREKERPKMDELRQQVRTCYAYFQLGKSLDFS